MCTKLYEQHGSQVRQLALGFIVNRRYRLLLFCDTREPTSFLGATNGQSQYDWPFVTSRCHDFTNNVSSGRCCFVQQPHGASHGYGCAITTRREPRGLSKASMMLAEVPGNAHSSARRGNCVRGMWRLTS